MSPWDRTSKMELPIADTLLNVLCETYNLNRVTKAAPPTVSTRLGEQQLLTSLKKNYLVACCVLPPPLD